MSSKYYLNHASDIFFFFFFLNNPPPPKLSPLPPPPPLPSSQTRPEAPRPASRSDSTAFRSHPVPTGSTVTTVLTASAESSPETSQNSPTRACGCVTVEPRT